MSGWKESIVWEIYDAKQNMHGSQYVGELIRCKDCRFSHITADGLLNKHCDNMTDDDGNKVELYVESTFYCGLAERKEE